MGGKNDSTDAETASTTVILPEGFGASFSERAIRAKFVRKVYAILLSQLSITTAFIAVFCFSSTIKNFYCDKLSYDKPMGIPHCVQASGNGFIVYIVSWVIFFVTYLSIACCEGLRKRSPANLIAMGIFTLALSVMASSIAVYHDVWWVMMAMGITALLCLGLTLFSFQTKWDFTGMGMYLFAASWILFIFGIVAAVFLVKQWPIVNLVYSALFGLLFSMFLVYDTQQIMGGKKYSISPEEHVMAAIQLYIDVVYIFLAILNLRGR